MKQRTELLASKTVAEYFSAQTAELDLTCFINSSTAFSSSSPSKVRNRAIEVKIPGRNTDIFQLRAAVLLVERLETQLALLQETGEIISSMQEMTG
jgi:hypothetical protein